MVEKTLSTQSYMAPVQHLIPLVEARMREQANGHNPDLAAAIEHLLDSGGKRIRPTICLLVAEMLGTDRERSITLAAAAEMLHTATLVHDDLIDGSLMRRGMPTLNANWSPSATILTGDFIFARAAKLAAETESIQLMDQFAQTLSVIVAGEVSQLFKSKWFASREDYFERIYAKTASMFELAAAGPAYLSEINDDMRNQLRRFGHHIGMAFQIVDDILDFTGAQVDIGKPVANDLRQGLFTLPALYYMEDHPDDPDMQTLINDEASTEHALNRLVHRIVNSVAIERSMDEARDFITRALYLLRDMPECRERQALASLARYIIDREL